MLGAVHVLGDYWRATVDEPTPLGALVAAAKERDDSAARAELCALLADRVPHLALDVDSLVLAVPPGPDRTAHPVPALAAAVAEALGVEPSELVARRNATKRLRDTAIELRRTVVEAAGYVVTGDVAGRSIVLVDDVVLTGTTLGYLAEILAAAGATRVDAVVVCRTRQSGRD